MNKVIRLLGSAIVSAIILAFPILCALSFALNWGQEAKVLLTIPVIFEYALLVMYLYFEYAENKR